MAQTLSHLERPEERQVTAAPVLKWAGGKGQLLPVLRERFPSQLASGEVHTYAEPFVGGGAVFFDLIQAYPHLERVFLYDVNQELVILYTVLRDDPDALINELGRLSDAYASLDAEEREQFFYGTRKIYNDRREELTVERYDPGWAVRAAQTMFLNRTCFNGLFRVNSKGEFNVPFGRYANPLILNEERLTAASRVLQMAEVRLADFSAVAEIADEQTFIYYDPPYRPISNTASFNAYMKSSFNDDEQERLATHFRMLDGRGVLQLLSNSDPTNHGDDPYFDELYAGFTIERVQANRMINSKASKRGAIRELLIHNYEV